jgi:cystathionine beta-lyase/cystathionine gamma-synthase
MDSAWDFPTRAIHAGQDPDPTTGSTIPPLHLTTTYTQQGPGEHKGYEYSRTQNPTKERLETALASLEGGAACAIFASGLAATTAVLHTLKPGDGVVAGHDLYGGTYRLLTKVFAPWGLEVAFTRDESPAAYREALGRLSRPRLVWLETPTNPLLAITDIAAVADVGHVADCKVVVDNTFASPYLQQPLALGADLVVHSTTKYLGGHSDVVGGAVIARSAEDLGSHAAGGIRFYQNAAGGQAGPFDAWLVHRGIKTLAVRMEQHCTNAEKFADALGRMPGIERVYYPGDPAHPGHAVAARQMRRFGGMVSAQLAGGMEETRKFLQGLRIFSLAESLGGVESLVCHPATMTHASIPRAEREARGVGDTLVRFSVGIEAVDDLVLDVAGALGA